MTRRVIFRTACGCEKLGEVPDRLPMDWFVPLLPELNLTFRPGIDNDMNMTVQSRRFRRESFLVEMVQGDPPHPLYVYREVLPPDGSEEACRD